MVQKATTGALEGQTCSSKFKIAQHTLWREGSKIVELLEDVSVERSCLSWKKAVNKGDVSSIVKDAALSGQLSEEAG